MEKLTYERLEVLTAEKRAKGLDNVITLLEVNELDAYMINITDAIARTTKTRDKYKVNGTTYNCFNDMVASLEILKSELEARMLEVAEMTNGIELVKTRKSVSKKAKLSPTQAELLESLKQAQYLYELPNGRTVDTYNFYVNNELLYFDIVNHEKYGRTLTLKSEANRIGDNEFTLRGHSSTLKALEKKGYITINELGGDAFDKISLVDAVEALETYNELEEIRLTRTYYSDYVKSNLAENVTLYCPVGQSQSTIEYYTNYRGLVYETVSINVVTVEAWKGF